MAYGGCRQDGGTKAEGKRLRWLLNRSSCSSRAGLPRSDRLPWQPSRRRHQQCQQDGPAVGWASQSSSRAGLLRRGTATGDFGRTASRIIGLGATRGLGAGRTEGAAVTHTPQLRRVPQNAVVRRSEAARLAAVSPPESAGGQRQGRSRDDQNDSLSHSQNPPLARWRVGARPPDEQRADYFGNRPEAAPPHARNASLPRKRAAARPNAP